MAPTSERDEMRADGSWGTGRRETGTLRPLTLFVIVVLLALATLVILIGLGREFSA